MRISVCEFLRLRTNKDWFYMEPGKWGSDGMKLVCLRESEGHFVLVNKDNKAVDSLQYFEGRPSNQVRQNNRTQVQKYRAQQKKVN